MEKIEITNAQRQLVLNDVCMDGSTFTNVSGKALLWDDVNLTGTKIKNANLSDLEIKGAQWSGAYFQHVKMPSKERPLRFDNCDLNNSSMTGCDLSGLEIKNCTLEGMKINGIAVTDMLKIYESFNK